MGNDLPTSDRSIVHVTVIGITQRGLLVKLPDGRKGFIYSQEWTWNRSLRRPDPRPRVGNEFDAIIVKETSRGPELSRRGVKDPWKEAIIQHRYKIGQVVEGEVVNVHPDKAFVQIEPGIDALLPPSGVPLLPYRSEGGQLKEPETLIDVLQPGDRISAHITNLEPGKQRMEISLTNRLQELVLDEERAQIQLSYFGADHHPRRTTGTGPLDASLAGLHDHANDFENVPYTGLAIPRPERFLVIDDEEQHLKNIKTWLVDEYHVEVDVTADSVQAEEMIALGRSYNIVIIDVQLGAEDGRQVAKRLQKASAPFQVLLTSAVGRLGLDDYNWEFPFCRKEKIKLLRSVDEILRGTWYIERRKPTNTQKIESRQSYFLRQLGMQALARRTLPENLAALLAQLHEQSRVSYCLVAELNPTGRAISILACHPALEPELYKAAQTDLYFSPVLNVIQDCKEERDNNIDCQTGTRYQNFFCALGPHSYLGLPLQIPDQPIRHALFLLDDNPLGFPNDEVERILQARLTGQLLAIAIERDVMIDYMRRFDEKYAYGQLIYDLIHETNNRLEALSRQINQLGSVVQARPRPGGDQKPEPWGEELDQAFAQTRDLQQELAELIHSYERQAKNETEPVEILSLLSGIEQQLRKSAMRASTGVTLDVPKNIPHIRAIGPRLQQVLLNLGLNAIQMIDLQRRKMEEISRQKSMTKTTTAFNGFIILQARYNPENKRLPIEIRVIDSGPGVHWQDQQAIFQMGVSTRPNGAGMGLFISRNLIERMGGRLRLLDSILFLGSVFVIELPAYSPTREAA